MKNIIPNSVFNLNSIFKENGFELFVVGGAVRDFVMGLAPKDFDLSTDALPDEIVRILGGRYKYDIHGKDFFVVVVYTDDCPMGFEIATFRSDVYDGKLGITRNPKVVPSDIDGDCERRDLNFNAMYYDISNDAIIDKLGGQQDIQNKICHFVGDPLMRIKEDPQRMVRILRFASRFTFEIEVEIISLIKSNIERLDIITRDRITKEFVAMFSYENTIGYRHGMLLMHQCGLFKYLFKAYNINTNVINSDHMEVHFAHMLRNVDEETLSNHMVEVLKFKKTFVTKVLFLTRLQIFDHNDVLNIYKKKRSIDLKDDIIKDFISLIVHPPVGLTKLLDFRPSVKSEDLINAGFIGAALGAEQQRLECEQFLQIL
jgi:tRNA nucleotidyltransferase/poly(A) polymerase